MTDHGISDHRRRLILVSNRGPLEHRRESGQRLTRRGGGGLVTALSGLADELLDAVWVCAAMTDEDAAAEYERGVPYEDDAEGGLRVRMVALDPDAREKFYGVIADPLLWFIGCRVPSGARASGSIAISIAGSLARLLL